MSLVTILPKLTYDITIKGLVSFIITPAGTVTKVRPRRTIVRGGSRVTRGKRSVFRLRVKIAITFVLLFTRFSFHKFKWYDDAFMWFRSEERRVGRECRSRWWAEHYKEK